MLLSEDSQQTARRRRKFRKTAVVDDFEKCIERIEIQLPMEAIQSYFVIVRYCYLYQKLCRRLCAVPQVAEKGLE